MADILTLRQISLTMQGKTLLKNINLSVPKGAYITLAGPSGAGKSTILKSVRAFYRPAVVSFYIKDKTPFRCRPRNIAATSPIVFNSPSCLAKRSATILISHFRFAIRLLIEIDSRNF